MLPTKLKAGGQEFAIEYKDFVAPGKRGMVNYGQTRIDIRSDHDIQTQAETIIHEAFHIAEAKSNLKLEEKIVQTFGRVLFAVLRDNPDLFNQDTIRICGFDYKVLRVDVVDKDSEADLASWVKHCEFRLAGDLSSENHGLHLTYMLLNATESVLDTDLDYDAKHRLGDWLHAILKDNPQIWPHNVIEEESQC